MDYVYSHLKQSGDLDEAFCEKAFEIMIDKEPQLDEWAKAVMVTDDDDDYLGLYDVDTKLITVNLKNVLADKNVNNKKILALEVLRHELEHARNVLKLYECREDIESIVLRASLKKYAIDQGIDISRTFDKIDPMSFVYHKKESYDFDPDERLAEINAWRYIVNLLKNQRRTADLLGARRMLYYSYIKGYKDSKDVLLAPTYKFLLNTGLYHQLYLLNKRVDAKDYSLETRLKCGLPINQKEHDVETLKKVKLMKRKRTL